MFRKIRKSRNEISVASSIDLLEKERRGVLSVNGDAGYPYAVPINYWYSKENNKIYFHGSHAGHKVDAIQKSDKVCFAVFGNETYKNNEWAPYVQSVIVFGRCRIISDPDLKIKLLRQFAKKYYPSDELLEEEMAISGKAANIFEIEIEYLSGKEIQEK